MAEYVELKAVLDKTFEGCGLCMEPIKDLPTIEVVRCKDCKYNDFDELYGNYWCNRTMCVIKVNADDFCKWGKRREDGRPN